MAAILLRNIYSHQWLKGRLSKDWCHYAEGMVLQQVSVILVEPVAFFEFGVAVEVFGIDRTGDGLPRFDFRVCATNPSRPLATNTTSSLSVTATHGLDGVAGSDLVVVAATARRSDSDYPVDVLDAIRQAHRDGSTILSLCSGSFVVGAAGLLDDLDCTTHWMHAADLQQRHPSARVDPGVLFVDTGSIITSAGTAAGIDACLHLGGVLRHDGDTEDARPYLKHALTLRPDSAPAQFQILALDATDGHLEEARTGLEKLVKQWPDFVEAHLQLATVYARLHLTQESARERQIVVELNEKARVKGPLPEAVP